MVERAVTAVVMAEQVEQLTTLLVQEETLVLSLAEAQEQVVALQVARDLLGKLVEPGA
jgi:hypothetical protein